eukprot:TRINITY_DN22525_c0_g1_i2.p3 TRINITY_DN22525_c0_g1~~TRINITY_DN22525_c0_g1_i2.p3  ORF type:complete len:213 (+),score=19.78 TRINITY_DN22525_c0_g1_i2:528-1166(+)
MTDLLEENVMQVQSTNLLIVSRDFELSYWIGLQSWYFFESQRCVWNEQWPDFGCEGIKVQRAHQPTSQCQGKRRHSSRSSSQSSATTYKLRLRKSDQNSQFEDVYQTLQSQSQSIMDIARQTLESIQQDSYTQYAQKKIRAALKHPASNQYVSTNQQRFRKEQLIMLQQQYQQQRRQLRRARKMSGKYNRASTFSGSLSPIPEVHTDGSYYD